MTPLALIELWQLWWVLFESAEPTSTFRLAVEGKIAGIEPIEILPALTTAAFQVISCEEIIRCG